MDGAFFVVDAARGEFFDSSCIILQTFFCQQFLCCRSFMDLARAWSFAAAACTLLAQQGSH